MFKKSSFGIKVIFFINTAINLLLLIPALSLLRILGSQLQILGLLVISINIILGIGVVLLKNWSRIGFVIMQIISFILSIWPFLCILTLGMNGGTFGERYEVPWAPISTLLFWKQVTSFIVGMSFPTIPMLFSIFCIKYLTRPKVIAQFK